MNPSTTEDLKFAPLDRDDPSAVGRLLYDWADRYLISSNTKLGRSGAVCPYVGLAVASQSLRYLSLQGTPSKEEILQLVTRARETFESIAKNELLSFIIAFPDLDDQNGKAAIAEVQQEAKLEFVKRGLMLGEFFQGNPSPGLHNKSFFPLRSPIPLLAIRRMLVEDLPFMDKPEDPPAVRVELITTYLDALGPKIPLATRKKALASRERAVVEGAPGSIPLERGLVTILEDALNHLISGNPQFDDYQVPSDLAKIRPILMETADRLRDNYPYAHPLYAGQMIKQPHPIARMAYALAQWVNPNNHAFEGGRATSVMEKEAVEAIARMFKWDRHLGHLCSGGTVANLEALWVASRVKPNALVVASREAHYTHKRVCEVLGIPFREIATDGAGRMDPFALDAVLEEGNVGTVVATMGTTCLGAIDPLAAILERQKKHGFRLHADCAYGGYFVLSSALSAPASEHMLALGQADSMVIDPHKHGLQPYGAGCVLFRDPSVGKFYKHESPYTYFTSAELHLGEITLECSRPGAAAAALWATQRLLPNEKDSEFSRGLDRCLWAARKLAQWVERSDMFALVHDPELDIVVFAARAKSASAASVHARRLFEGAAAKGLHLALTRVTKEIAGTRLGQMQWDQSEVLCLRSCLMKWDHLDWIDTIAATLAEVWKETVS